MSTNGRPLSPHISIYRWPITMTTSILHRATGVAISVGFIVLVAWLCVAAAGFEAYTTFVSIMDTVIGKVLLIGWSFAFFFHFSNGLRHLVWDTGRGFEMRQVNASAWLVIISSVVMTALFWWSRA